MRTIPTSPRLRSARWVLALAAAALPACSSSPNAPEPPPLAPPAMGVTGTTITQVPNEGWRHVDEGSPVSYAHNPPASGPHYPVWARYEEYATPLARGYWVHNLEHGAVVFLYRPDASAALVASLRTAFQTLPPDPECGHPRALLTPDPALTRPIAVVAANWVLESDLVESAAIREFALAHRNHAPEDLCGGGTRP